MMAGSPRGACELCRLDPASVLVWWCDGAFARKEVRCTACDRAAKPPAGTPIRYKLVEAPAPAPAPAFARAPGWEAAAGAGEQQEAFSADAFLNMMACDQLQGLPTGHDEGTAAAARADSSRNPAAAVGSALDTIDKLLRQGAGEYEAEGGRAGAGAGAHAATFVEVDAAPHARPGPPARARFEILQGPPSSPTAPNAPADGARADGRGDTREMEAAKGEAAGEETPGSAGGAAGAKRRRAATSGAETCARASKARRHSHSDATAHDSDDACDGPEHASKRRSSPACTPPRKSASARACLHCGVTDTPQWRTGPAGPKTLCNACGVRFKAGRLVLAPKQANGGTALVSSRELKGERAGASSSAGMPRTPRATKAGATASGRPQRRAASAPEASARVSRSGRHLTPRRAYGA